MSASHAAVVDGLQGALRLLRWEHLPRPQREGDFALSRLCAAGAAALSDAGHPAYKFLAFDLLVALARPLVLEDGERRARASASGAPAALTPALLQRRSWRRGARRRRRAAAPRRGSRWPTSRPPGAPRSSCWTPRCSSSREPFAS